MRKIPQPSLPEEATIPVRRSIGDQLLTNEALNSPYKVTFEPRTSRTIQPAFSCDFYVAAQTKEAARILAERGLLARYPDAAFCFHAPDICRLSARDFHVKKEARINAVRGTLMHACALFSLFDDEPEFDDDQSREAAIVIVQPWMNERAYSLAGVFASSIHEILQADGNETLFADVKEGLIPPIELARSAYERAFND